MDLYGPAACGFFAKNAGKGQKDEKKENYSSEGIALGMCFGAAIGTALGNNTGSGLTAGMLLGLAFGSCIEKKKNNGNE